MRARSGCNGMKPKQARSGSFVFSLDHAVLGAEEEKANTGVNQMGFGMMDLGRGQEGK